MIIYNLNRQDALLAGIGGLFIGISISLWYVLYGKIFHITNNLTKLKWNLQESIYLTAFAGIIFCSAFYMELYHEHFVAKWLFQEKSITKMTPPIIFFVSGFLAGIGSSIAQGGTYTHIFAGMARLNLNSIIASITIFAAGYYAQQKELANWIQNMSLNNYLETIKLPKNISREIIIIITMSIPFYCFLTCKNKNLKTLIKLILSFLTGIIGGIGILISGEANRQITLGMLRYDHQWNPRLLVSLATALVITFLIYIIMFKGKLAPVFETKVEETTSKISIFTVIGSILLGISWGLAGISLISVLVLLPMNDTKILFFWGGSVIFGKVLAQLCINIASLRKSSKIQ